MPWTAKQHLWKSKAKGHQLSRGGPSNRQKNDIKNCVTRYVVPCSVNFKIKWQAKTTGPKVSLVLALQKKRQISSGWDTFYIHVSATMNGHVI